jgi:biotin operon repressor
MTASPTHGTTLETDQFICDEEMTLPSGLRLQCSSTYVWPDAQTFEAQGGIIFETDQDGTALVVAWPETGQFTFNPQRLSVFDVELRLQVIYKMVKSALKKSRKAKGFKKG